MACDLSMDPDLYAVFTLLIESIVDSILFWDLFGIASFMPCDSCTISVLLIGITVSWQPRSTYRVTRHVSDRHRAPSIWTPPQLGTTVPRGWFLNGVNPAEIRPGSPNSGPEAHLRKTG